MIKQLLYRLLGKAVNISFNILNLILAGNLPPLGCACVVVEEEGRLLVIERTKDQFVFPGGFMRWREQPAETAQRECREETGLEVQMLDTIGTYATTSTRIDRMSSLMIVFAGEVIGGALRGSIEGHPCWLNEADMRKGLDKYFTRILEDYFAYRQQLQAQASFDTAAPDLSNE